MRKFAIDKKVNDAKAELIVLRNYCKLTGIDLYVEDCVICHNHHIKTVSFQKHGLLCGQCFEKSGDHLFSLEFSKLVYHLFKDQYEKMDKLEDYFYELEMLFIKNISEKAVYDNVRLFLIKEYCNLQ